MWANSEGDTPARFVIQFFFILMILSDGVGAQEASSNGWVAAKVFGKEPPRSVPKLPVSVASLGQLEIEGGGDIWPKKI